MRLATGFAILVSMVFAIPAQAGAPIDIGIGLDRGVHVYNTDTYLGGLKLRNGSGSVHINKDGQSYSLGDSALTPIYASTLFNLLSVDSFDLFASKVLGQAAEQVAASPLGTANEFPSAADLYTEYTRSVSKKLTQVFILKTIANILDSEARFAGMSFQVPEERVSYAVRKILLVDNKNLNHGVMVDGVATASDIKRYGTDTINKFIQSLTDRFNREGIRGVNSLSEIGLTGQSDFRTNFDRAMNYLVQSQGRPHANSAYGLKLLSYDEIPAEVLAYYHGTLEVPEEVVLFYRLQEKVGDKPFKFSVSWNLSPEESSDDILEKLSQSFRTQWLTANVDGGNPPSVPESFPHSYEEFRSFVHQKLFPVQKFQMRMGIVTTMLAKKYPMLYNPRPPRDLPHGELDLYNPEGPARFPVTKAELDNLYYLPTPANKAVAGQPVLTRQVNAQIAGIFEQKFSLTEISIGDIAGVRPTDVTPTGDMLELPVVDDRIYPCAQAFRAAFEPRFNDRQAKIYAALQSDLKSKRISASEYVRTMTDARKTIPAESFELALKSVANKPVCRQVKLKLRFVDTVVKSGVGHDLPEIENAESKESGWGYLQFLDEVKSNPKLQSFMIPSSMRVDSQGNVHHYFAHDLARPKVTFAARDDDRVTSKMRLIIAKKRIADFTAEALNQLIGTRYRIDARTEPFAYDGVSGYRLDPRISDARKWIPDLFAHHNKSMFETAFGF